MSRHTTIHFPPVCDNCHERHEYPEDWSSVLSGDPGCDWDRMSGNGLGPAERRYEIHCPSVVRGRSRGWIGRHFTADERADMRELARERLTGGRTSSYYGVNVGP